MVVNSISFLLFFAVVFIVYYLLKGKDGKRQNLWLLVASYFFYGYTEWRMLPLLIFTTLFFYGLGIAIGYYNEKDEKKAFELIHDCAIQGHLPAIYDLGANFYYNGVGTDRNLKLSEYYLRMAVNAGLPRAKLKFEQYRNIYESELEK